MGRMNVRALRFNRMGFLGLAAALFLALGPVLAPVLAAMPQGRTIEICTVFGLVKQAVAGDYELPGPSGDHKGASGHCLLCTLRQAALIPQAPALPLPSGIFVTTFFPAAALPAGIHAARPYNPRAPPAFLLI